ncbi:DUF1311 domain-containing protein [Trinickia terrae]|uniref:DUF1311 domain-containing protein n=1 Tax=Trinickia terrae TaxID=2571161 RepID=A0A4U1HDC4_9BURK|nr:lysozyme inhibitor LprI family protein [Trinickia terrae]TKC78925.1 DUF1311 domain-containing protein [Trinickia terrae]
MAVTGILIFSGSVFSKMVCDSQVTSEIESCARSNFQLADKDLNEKYRGLIGKFDGVDRENLRSAQRYWVVYKDRYCEAAFDATNPGAEAAVEKWACLESVTAERTRELGYIDASSDMTGFYRALTFVARYYEGGDQR